MIRTYLELSQLKTFEERYEYCKDIRPTINGRRWLKQTLYRSPEWKKIRRQVIIRDNGCDLGIEDRPIVDGRVYIHHLNEITEKMILERSPEIFDLNNLISVSYTTHNMIHNGSSAGLIPSSPVERKPGDTKLW